MRIATPTELGLLRAGRLVCHFRAEITNPSGAWIDYTNAYGVNWLKEARWSGTIDKPVMSGTLTLLREDTSSGISLAPSMTGSPANSGGPGIEKGRLIRLSTACVPPGTLPGVVDWREVMLGIVDGMSYGGKAPVMMVEFRDIGALFLDTNITAERVYGSVAGVDAAVVMGQIGADNWSTIPYGAMPGVYVPDPVASAFAVSPAYPQRMESLLDAYNNLAMQFGQVVRYKYDALDVFRLTLYDPQRDRTDVDATFAPGEFIDLPRFYSSRDDVRNQVRVRFVNQYGQQQEYYATDTTSIAAFGPKFMFLGLDVASQVRTFAQAAKLADSALWDLSEPLSEHQTESFLWWPAELGDRYTYQRNDRQYDVDQTLAVVGFEHVYTAPGKARTLLTTRGKVAGLGRQWRERGKVGGIPIDRVRPQITGRVGPGTGTLGANVNVYLTPTTTYPEQLGVRIYWRNDPDAVALTLVTGPASTVPKFVDSGTEIGPTDWWYFNDGAGSSGWMQSLANVPLLDLSTQTLYAQSYGFMSQLSSDRVAIILDTRPRPELAAASISASNPKQVGGAWLIVLTVTMTGGRGIKSVSDMRIVDVDADPADAIVDSVNIDPGQTITRKYPILASASEVLDKTWGAILTPNTNPLATAATGLVGFPITVTTAGDAYENASAADLQAATDNLQTQIDAIPLGLAPSVQLPFGNFGTMAAAGDISRAAPAAPFRVVAWHLDAVDATGAKVAISAAFTIRLLPFAGGAPVVMVTTGAAQPKLVTVDANTGTTSGWTVIDGAAGDSLMATLDSITPGTAKSLLLTLTLQAL